MPEPPQLEITIERGERNYIADLRFTSSAGTLTIEHANERQIDLKRLRELKDDPDAYGRLLGDAMWVGRPGELLRDAYQDANGEKIRLRLVVHPTAHELHSVRWELMTGDDGNPLTTRESVAFSRFLSSPKQQQKRPVSEKLSMLAAVASPADIEEYRMAKIDVAAELKVIGEVSAGACDMRPFEGPCSVRNLMMHLRDGVDVLYLVCHGALVDGEPHLWLEKDGDGMADVVDGRGLISRLNDLAKQPRLIVLASCQSGGDGRAARLDEKFPLAALGPRMAEAGIPAVIAMMGDVTIGTVKKFFLSFFQQLVSHWTIDLAMSAARGDVRDRPDWWVPVLFTRLNDAKVWYKPGLEGGEVRWPAIVGTIRDGECTAVIGPDIGESIYGSQRDLALSMAKRNGFPLATYFNDDLAKVTQYLEYAQTRKFWQRELTEARIATMKERFEDLPVRDTRALDAAALSRHARELRAAAREKLVQRGRDPYTHLAGLPIKRFITADPSPLLAEALKKQGKTPQEVICVWRDDLLKLPEAHYKPSDDGEESADAPLVYYVFGREQNPETLVVTEDDFFHFMKGIVQQQEHIPSVIQDAVSDSGLMFLGFGIDDWSFRAMFRTFMSFEGAALRRGYSHVAVQVDLADGQVQDTRAAKRHLVKFLEGSRIDIYWGRVHDFLRALQSRLEQK